MQQGRGRVNCSPNRSESMAYNQMNRIANYNSISVCSGVVMTSTDCLAHYM
jgi:hypothetical protein